MPCRTEQERYEAAKRAFEQANDAFLARYGNEQGARNIQDMVQASQQRDQLEEEKNRRRQVLDECLEKNGYQPYNEL
jgi:hypothetical protein